MYLATSANNKIAASILLDLVAALGTWLCVGVEPVCCLTVIAALAEPSCPSAEAYTFKHLTSAQACSLRNGADAR